MFGIILEAKVVRFGEHRIQRVTEQVRCARELEFNRRPFLINRSLGAPCG